MKRLSKKKTEDEEEEDDREGCKKFVEIYYEAVHTSTEEIEERPIR